MENTALVVGATGLVGNLVLLELSNNNKNIFAVTRSSIEHPNVSELDFDLFIKDGLLPVCEHIYICLGTTIKKAGSQDEFRKVDFDYSLAFAKKARKLTSKPLMLTGGFKSKDEATQALSCGAVDILNIGRAMALNPNLANDWFNDLNTNPKFPRFDSSVPGGITAWFTMLLTSIAEDREDEFDMKLLEALEEYEKRDAERTVKWKKFFTC